MKYFLAILMYLVLAQPAFAAKTVKGTVPQVQPLQPQVPNVRPHFEANVQYQSDTVASGTVPTVPNQPDQNQLGDSGQNSSSAAATAAKTGPSAWVLIAVVVLALCGFIWLLKQRGKS